ncbi:MAG: hypothetical protein CM1200mP10_25750 [Candidatus Neomarinimicrobiota bacterium]|nr:MAG: hypothetical protein CM1200mP10_25750 [Candidatus Neomarinimicrobiota bacterium]
MYLVKELKAVELAFGFAVISKQTVSGRELPESIIIERQLRYI